MSELIGKDLGRFRHFIPDIIEREALLSADVGYRKIAARDSRLLPLPHEKVPRPSYILYGKPVLVFAPSFTLFSNGDLLRLSLLTYDNFATMIGSFLGPRRLYKLYINENGVVFLLSSLSVLSKLVRFRSPFLDIVLGAGLSMSKSVGDHGVYTALLSSLLAKKCLEVIARDEGSRSDCLNAFHNLSKLATNFLETLSRSNIYNPAVDKARVLATAKGWLGNYFELLVRLADEAFALIKSIGLDFDSIRLEDILDIRIEPTGDLSDSFVLKGVAYPKETPYIFLPTKMSPAKIAVLLGGLVTPTEVGRGFNFTFEINKKYNIKIINERTRLLYQDYLKNLSKLGVNVLVVEKGIDENILSLLSQLGLMAVRRFSPPEIESVALATGARPVPILHPVEAEDLGYAESVEYRKIKGKDWILFCNCRQPHRITVLIHGVPEYMSAQVEQAFKELLYFLVEYDRNPAVIPGGGALEVGLAVLLRKYATRVGDRRQLVLIKFAEALEELVLYLVRNSGKQPLDVLLHLKKEHAAGNHLIGFNALTGKVVDVVQEGIVDVLSIKKQALLNAIEAAYTLTRIDAFVVDRLLSKEERYYKKRTEALSENKIAKEYKLEISEIVRDSYS